MNLNSSWIPIVIAVVAVIVIVAVIWGVLQSRRRKRLREHFGPEYDHVVEETGSRRDAARGVAGGGRRRPT